MALKNKIKILRNIKKKAKKFIYIDILKCYYKYGCSLKNYDDYDFETLTDNQRETYITDKINKLIIEKNNKPSYLHFIEDKKEFINNFKDLININNIELSNIKGNILDNLNNFVQNKKLQELDNKISVIEITTFNNDNKIDILQSVLNIGNENLIAYLNENGTIIAPAIDINNKIIGIHPKTKKQILGFKIPNYKLCIDKVIEASKRSKNVKYITWKLIMSNDDIHLIEASTKPLIRQLKPQFSKNKLGLLKKYKEIIK